jgi:hypothetical protein
VRFRKQSAWSYAKPTDAHQRTRVPVKTRRALK